MPLRDLGGGYVLYSGPSPYVTAGSDTCGGGVCPYVMVREAAGDGGV